MLKPFHHLVGIAAGTGIEVHEQARIAKAPGRSVCEMKQQACPIGNEAVAVRQAREKVERLDRSALVKRAGKRLDAVEHSGTVVDCVNGLEGRADNEGSEIERLMATIEFKDPAVQSRQVHHPLQKSRRAELVSLS